MYQLINEHIEALLVEIDYKKYIQPYLFICKEFSAQTEFSDTFKKSFKTYYRLHGPAVSDDFSECFFELLNEFRSKPEVEIKDIVHRLYELPSNDKGAHKVHFSFASKFVHTLNNSRPIYDSLVAAFYLLPNISPGWKLERKFKAGQEIYTFLNNEYDRVINEGLLADAIDRFRAHFELGEEYSDVKVIDTLIWRFTAMVKSGAIMDARIQYR